MIAAGRKGFQKNQSRKFNIRAADLVPGDDFGMMREVLNRRFKRLLNEAPRPMPGAYRSGAQAGEPIDIAGGPDGDAESPWPDLVIIEGGRGQLSAAPETLTALGILDVPLVAVAKGAARDAGVGDFFPPRRDPLQPQPPDSVPYFVGR